MSSFPQFPEFTELKWEHKEEYEELVRGYPPIADITFARLMVWWSVFGRPKISLINQNLLLSYVEDDGSNSLSIIGTENIDESICEIFDYLRRHKKYARLRHVPELVVTSLKYPELFNFTGERGYDEYVVELTKFYPLEKSIAIHRHKTMQFLRKSQNSHVGLETIDLSEDKNCEMLLKAVTEWPVKGVNNLAKRSPLALVEAINNASRLGLHCACLYIDGGLHAFMLFQATEDKEVVILEYVRTSYAIPNLMSFITFIFSEWFIQQGIRYVNLCVDFDRPIMRVTKLALNPINFVRKYTLEPQVMTSPLLQDSPSS